MRTYQLEYLQFTNCSIAFTKAIRSSDGSFKFCRYKFYFHGHDTGYSYDGVHGEEQLRNLIEQPIASLNEMVCDSISWENVAFPRTQ